MSVTANLFLGHPWEFLESALGRDFLWMRRAGPLGGVDIKPSVTTLTGSGTFNCFPACILRSLSPLSFALATSFPDSTPTFLLSNIIELEVEGSFRRTNGKLNSRSRIAVARKWKVFDDWFDF